MSNVLKLSGALKVGSLAAAPSNPQEGYIYYDTVAGTFQFYENGAFREVSAQEVAAHLTDDSALKHDADEIDYERADGSRKNIQADATSPNVAAALNDLDDAIGLLDATPTNYTAADPAIVADHLAGIDTALGSMVVTPEFADDEFRIQDDGDATKEIAFQAAAITTGTVRTITMPDANVNLAEVNSSIQQNGSRAFTADQSMGGNQLTSVGTPVAGTDAANKDYVDAIAQGLEPKGSVRAASTANVVIASALEDGDSLDGVTLAEDDRVLLKNQTDPVENGVYVVSASGAASRAADFNGDPSNEVKGGDWVYVEEGTSNIGTSWAVLGNGEKVVDTDEILFTKINKVTPIQGGDAITVSGDEIDVNVDNSTIEVSSDALRVKDAGITNAKVATGIDAAKLADGSVSNAEFQFINSLSSNAQDQLDAKLENVVEDTTPELGGDLDVNGFAIEDATGPVLLAGQNAVRRAKQASKSSFVEEEYIHSTALAGSQTNTVIAALTYAFATYEALEITYKFKQTTSNNVRIGTIRVVTNGSAVVLNDVMTDSADTGISFSAAINGANVEIRYSSGANGGTLRMDVKKFLT